MDSLSATEAMVCNSNPISVGLDAFRASFLSEFKVADPNTFKEVVGSLVTDEVARRIVKQLFRSLLSLPAASLLPSRQSSSPPEDLLARCFLHISSGSANLAATALLLERVIERASDHDIWSAVYGLVPPTTPPRTPRVTTSIVPSTPHSFGSGVVHNTDEGWKYMDSVIENEMKDHIYLDIPEFFAVFFDSIDDLPNLVDAVFDRCRRSASYTNTNQWSEFLASCIESNIATWFLDEVDRIVGFALDAGPENVHAEALNSRCVVSMPGQPIPGSTAPRKLDIGFATRNGADDSATIGSRNRNVSVSQWEDVLVPGELKKESAGDQKPSTWRDLGRYVREVYKSQDTRRFCHGFTLCGDMMRVWKYDRGGIYAAPPFSVNEDGRRFVTVVLGYLLMGDDELGFDTTVARDGDRRYIPISQDGIEKQFFIERTLHRQACIIGRATTCWKVTLEGETTPFVIKDSWHYVGKDDEGELLMDVANAGVRHVAPCYHCASVRIDDDKDDDLSSCVRKELDLLSGKKWKPRKGRAGSVSSMGWSSNSSYKRVASTTLDNDRSQKRSRSNTRGDSGSGNPPEDQLQNRIHKRVVMSICGKQLNFAKTRIGLLRGLRDRITGHRNLLHQKKILHRDISIGNVLITEDENEGFLIDLDHAVRVDREGASGAKGRTGKKVFMSIGLLQGDSEKPHSFMGDLESMFWLLFWICIHYSGPVGEQVGSTGYEMWNYHPTRDLAKLKAGEISDEEDFLNNARHNFTEYYRPLVPWVNELRREVFPGVVRWKVEDLSLYDRMRDVLGRAMKDPFVKADWPKERK